MKKILAVIGLLAASLFGVVLSDDPTVDAEFTFIQIFDNFTLDPQRMSYNHDLRMAYAIYEPLVRWDNEDPDFGILPAAADRWTVSDDGLVYTFHIREAARWSNGDPVTAGDYRYAWQRALMPETASTYSGLFFRIEGAAAFLTWRTEQTKAYGALSTAEKLGRFGLTDAVDDRGRPMAEAAKLRLAAQRLRAEADEHFRRTVGIEAVDDRTLRVTLARPTGYFLDLAAFGPFCPVHPPTVERFVDLDPQTGRIKQRPEWTKPGVNVCNGPYVVKQWRFKRDMLLEANPRYWNPGIVRSRTVKAVTIEDSNTSALTFLTGGADWDSDTRVDYLDEMIRKKRLDDDDVRDDHDCVQVLSTFGTYFWWFNCRPTLTTGEPNPFHDARVRRAFARSIDKALIVEKVKKTGERPADVLVPRGAIGGFNSPDGLGYDVGAAKRDLADAGWLDRDGDGVLEDESGRPFPVVELLCSTGSYHDEVALAMGRMWEESIGVKSSILQRESGVYKDNIKKQDYMMARGGWFGDYGDPTTFLDLHKTGDGQNRSGYSDPVLDDLLARADAEPDAAARMRVLEEAERYTMEESMPVLPIWQYNYYYLYWDPEKRDGSPNPGGVRGVSHHPRLIQYLWKMEVVRPGAGG